MRIMVGCFFLVYVIIHVMLHCFTVIAVLLNYFYNHWLYLIVYRTLSFSDYSLTCGRVQILMSPQAPDVTHKV